jgi:hypothetical protein
MLAYLLALAVGFGSLAIYMAAFFFPEVHRKSDFPWSGVGLFYALILWVCAGRITGAVLLGQIASVALLGWFGWQTLILRRELTPVARQTPIPNFDLAGKSTGFKGLGSIADLFGNKKDKSQKKTTTEGSTSGMVTKTSDYAASATVDGAIASSPDTVSTTAEIPLATIGDVANTSIQDDLVSNSAGVISQEVTPPQEISQVELPTVSPEAIAPVVTQTQPDDDAFDDLEDFPEITQEKSVSPSPVVAATKPKRSSAGFGSLLSNLKNSLGNLGGFGKGKTKPAETTKEVKTSIADAGIPLDPTADIDRILESNSVESVPELVPETPISLTKTSDDIKAETTELMTAETTESMTAETTELMTAETTELMTAETTESMTAETTESMTPEVKEETVRSPGKVTEVIATENLTAAVDALETVAPTPPVEIAKMVAESPTEPLSLGENSEPKKAESTESSEIIAEVTAVEVKELKKDAKEKLVKPDDSDPA